jgi:RNA polymerase sigma factor (sigma-70 family)
MQGETIPAPRVRALVRGRERKAVDAESALAAIVAGDMVALESLYRELRTPVFAVALAITADRALAEDILQEAFVRVYARARTYRPGSRPRAWVVAIARNLALDAVRRRTRERATSTVAAPALVENQVVAELHVMSALLDLDTTERQIVALHDLAGLTHAEIGRELGLPAGTVRWKYRVALRRLESALEGSWNA